MGVGELGIRELGVGVGEFSTKNPNISTKIGIGIEIGVRNSSSRKSTSKKSSLKKFSSRESTSYSSPYRSNIETSTSI